MTAGSALRIVSVFPELLGTYGDGGNIMVLGQRLAWRGVPHEVVTVALDEPVPCSGDLYVLGGGEDDAQLVALTALRRSSGLTQALDVGAHVFGVCAGLQLLGQRFDTATGTAYDGLGVLDAVTTRLTRRAVGEVAAEFDAELGLPTLTGFENHAGATTLGPAARPLATVTRGTGNGADGSRGEGALQGRVVATYLHGPVLARNPALADLLLSRALGRPLDELDPGPHELLRRQRLAGLP